MKITIIDQHSGSIHEVPSASPEAQKSADFSWFDPEQLMANEADFMLTEDDEMAATKRVRFSDGREIEINPNTGDLLTV